MKINKNRLDKFVEFHLGWDNLNKRQRQILNNLLNERILKDITCKELTELNMLGIINKKCK